MQTIDAYIFKEQPDKASQFLNTFSKLIRSVLENSQHALISLNKELEGLRLFIQLEQERYDRSFDVVYDISDQLSNEYYKIPPLLIQPYVENAILHGLRYKKNGRGRLEIVVDRTEHHLVIIIKDNGIGRAAASRIKPGQKKTKESFGLTITQQRVERLPQKGSVEIVDIVNKEETGTEVRLLLPLIS